jgi:heat shock protein HslJ
VEGDVLTLLDADDAELLEFEVAMPVGSWLATSILRRDALTSPIAGTELTALFAESGEVSGDTGCNTYLGEYATDLGAIQISPSTTTEK